MSQNKELLDVVTLHSLVSVVCIIVADFNHLTNEGTDNEQGIAVEGGNWVVNDDDFIFLDTICVTAFDPIVEIKERQKVTLAIAQTDSNLAVSANDFICILCHIAFRRLNELYARTDQVGFMTTQRVDGKLILPEAVQCLQMKAGA